MADLSRAQQENLKTTFRFLDKNDNNMISTNELDFVFKQFGQSVTQQDLANIIAEVDIAGKGGIVFDDFASVIMYVVM